MIFWSRSSSALFLPDRAPFDGLILRYETTFYFPVRFRKIKRFLFFNLSLSRSGKETRSKQTRKSWFKWKSRGIDNFNTFRRGWKVSRGVGVTNRGADGGWISTSCKLGVEGGVALRPLRWNQRGGRWGNKREGCVVYRFYRRNISLPVIRGLPG